MWWWQCLLVRIQSFKWLSPCVLDLFLKSVWVITHKIAVWVPHFYWSAELPLLFVSLISQYFALNRFKKCLSTFCKLKAKQMCNNIEIIILKLQRHFIQWLQMSFINDSTISHSLFQCCFPFFPALCSTLLSVWQRYRISWPSWSLLILISPPQCVQGCKTDVFLSCLALDFVINFPLVLSYMSARGIFLCLVLMY